MIRDLAKVCISQFCANVLYNVHCAVYIRLIKFDLITYIELQKITLKTIGLECFFSSAPLIEKKIISSPLFVE